MTMAQVQKIILSSSRDILSSKLLLSQVQRAVDQGRRFSTEELAEDIARRTLLRSITMRPVCDADTSTLCQLDKIRLITLTLHPIDWVAHQILRCDLNREGEQGWVVDEMGEWQTLPVAQQDSV